MSPQSLCDLLDSLQITTKEAAKRMGIARVTLEQYCNGARYKSHGGKAIEHVPRWLELLARDLT